MENLEMRGPLPHIIALPYGKSPPMHIRAASWRQLLKLMAKLGATRIEPSVQAVAATKGELKLRTVVQFFKVTRFLCVLSGPVLIFGPASSDLDRMADGHLPHHRLS